MTQDITHIAKQFPILHQEIYGKRLVYLDNAATTQKPQSVLDAVMHYYVTDNANVHRGVHALSERATADYEASRKAAQQFINARNEKEIIFTRGTTEGINLIAQSYLRPLLAPGDEIILTELEHHSNIVPWKIVSEQTGAVLKIVRIDERCEIDLNHFEQLLSKKTKLVAVGHASNALGNINPIEKIITLAHQVGAKVVIDGAQAAPHLVIDVQALDCDFYAFSSHKVYGPTGIGVLYGKADLLEAMPPYQGGGEMINTVTFEKIIYHNIPHKFEAGTPNISGAVGLHAAIDFINKLGHDTFIEHEQKLLVEATQKLAAIPGLKIIGDPAQKVPVISFVMDTIHPHDIGTVVDREGVAIRVGHHCAMPLMTRLGLSATARASFAIYNTSEDIDALVEALYFVKRLFK